MAQTGFYMRRPSHVQRSREEPMNRPWRQNTTPFISVTLPSLTAGNMRGPSVVDLGGPFHVCCYCIARGRRSLYQHSPSHLVVDPPAEVDVFPLFVSPSEAVLLEYPTLIARRTTPAVCLVHRVAVSGAQGDGGEPLHRQTKHPPALHGEDGSSCQNFA